MKQPEQISECSCNAWTFLSVVSGFSYHRTEGQELSMQCLGRRTKASVKKLLLFMRISEKWFSYAHFNLWYISSHSIIGIGAF